MKLIVGLGNPGREYAQTRHNAGFMVVDRLAARHGLSGTRSRFHAGVIDGQILQQRITLMQPTTYMNRSGQAVGEAQRFFKLTVEDLMIVVDDTALPIGSIRMRSGGSSGGHHGLADIERALGTAAYPRLRIGVGSPTIGEQTITQTDYVLGRFTESQRPALEPALDAACNAIEYWLTDGIDKAMTRFNARDNESSEQNDDPSPESSDDRRADIT